MNPSPWPEGLRLGPQSSPARSPACAGTQVLWGGPLLFVLVLASRQPSEGVDTVAPARSWTGTSEKQLSLPRCHRLPRKAPHQPMSASPSPLAVCMALTQQRGAAGEGARGTVPPPEDLPCCAGHSGQSSGFVGFAFCLQGEGWAQGGGTDVSST